MASNNASVQRNGTSLVFSGVLDRAAVTAPYRPYQNVLAIGVRAKSLPVVIWCQKVRNTAA